MTDPTVDTLISSLPPVVALHGIDMSFGSNQVLHSVSFAVQSGRSHALLGRNGAGKSTAVGIITGLLAPDAGHVEFNGEPAPSRKDIPAWQTKVACLYQHSTVVPSLTVGENLYINRQPHGRLGSIDWRKMYRDAQELLDEWQVPVDARARMSDLQVGARQLVEIARALSSGARFVILDEPTAKLDRADAMLLFGHMRRMQAAGVTFLYISHHLEEIYEVTQDFTVLRDGRHIVTADVASTSASEVIEYMAGDSGSAPVKRLSENVARRDAIRNAEPVLIAEGLGSTDAGEPFSGVDLTVRRGEIVGLAGLEGGGKLGVAHVIVGMAKATQGSATINGAKLGTGNVGDAISNGVGFVPEDRQRLGLVDVMSVAENGTLSALDRLGRAGFFARRAQVAAGTTMIHDLDILAPSAVAPVSALSGGNQQKVLFGRAMATNPDLLVLVQPTAGVDVRSKDALFDVIDQNATKGSAVLLISDDLQDLRSCDRIIVMFRGQQRAEVAAGWRDADLIAAMEGVENDQH